MNGVNRIAMLKGTLFIIALIFGIPDAIAAPVIRSIRLEGNIRIPEASILARISSRPNESPNRASIREDLRRLHRLGLFEDLKVALSDAGSDQVDLIYRVSEYPLISSFSIEGVDESLETQIGEYLRGMRLELSPATAFNPSSAHKAALAVRDFLRGMKYPNAEVQILAEERGSTVRITIRIVSGNRLEVGAVRFLGNESIPENELLDQMQHARPAPFWARWGGAARLVPEELNSDLDRIRFHYMSNGFATVLIGKPRIFATGHGGKPRLEIDIPIVEGPRYSLASLGIEGNAKTGSDEVEKIINAVETPCEYSYSHLESTRQEIANLLGHHGYAMASVKLKQSLNEVDRIVEAVYKLEAGDPATVGRIVFEGNRRIPGKFLRRELRLVEGELFDIRKLDQSVERLNKGNLVHEILRSDVSLKMNSKTKLLDITFRVKEKDRQGIYFTGGSRGATGGYLGVLYTAFNLMRLGETLSLELDGGASQSNMLLNIVGARFLGNPFTLALSVFNSTTGINVANIVPGPDDLVEIFYRRRTGAGLSGVYPVTEDLHAGLGFELSKESIMGSQAGNSGPKRSAKSELTPFLLFDRTSGSGLETRGFRARYSRSWSGSLFLQSMNSTSGFTQLSYYLQDPWSRGRNSFAFRFQWRQASPLGSQSLLPENRFYPGNEIVRGFGRGSLSPWSAAPERQNPSLQATGADKALGISAEYRIPIHGALSGLGFFDLGWSQLDSRNATQSGSGTRIIERTNGVVRSSLGGELRLQLPIIHQPARLIFSWNPLRLSTLFSGASSVLDLAEPRTALRFALGESY